MKKKEVMRLAPQKNRHRFGGIERIIWPPDRSGLFGVDGGNVTPEEHSRYDDRSNVDAYRVL